MHACRGGADGDMIKTSTHQLACVYEGERKDAACLCDYLPGHSFSQPVPLPRLHLTPLGGGEGGLDSPVVFLLPSAMVNMRASGRQFAGVQAVITNGSNIMLDSFETTEAYWMSVFGAMREFPSRPPPDNARYAAIPLRRNWV